jgi:tetratricopeptide (TPR) repeat protein
LLAGDYDEALTLLDDASALATPESVGPNQRLMLRARLAEAHLHLGNRERALAIASEAAEAARDKRRLGAADAFLALARVLRASNSDRVDEIEAALDSAFAVVRHCSARVYEPAIGEERARLAALRDHHEEAARGLAEALRVYAEIGASGHVRRLTAEIDGGRARQTA